MRPRREHRHRPLRERIRLTLLPTRVPGGHIEDRPVLRYSGHVDRYRLFQYSGRLGNLLSLVTIAEGIEKSHNWRMSSTRVVTGARAFSPPNQRQHRRSARSSCMPVGRIQPLIGSSAMTSVSVLQSELPAQKVETGSATWTSLQRRDIGRSSPIAGVRLRHGPGHALALVSVDIEQVFAHDRPPGSAGG